MSGLADLLARERDYRPAVREEDLLFADDVAALRLTAQGSACVVLLNGFFMPELSSLPDDGLLEISDGLIRIPAGIAAEQVLEVLHVSFSFESGFIAKSHWQVVLEAGAQVTFIEHYQHLADTQCLNQPSVDMSLAEGARLHHVRLQNESLRTRHVSSLTIQQAAGSHYQGTSLLLGAAGSRTGYQVSFTGTQAQCELGGFYLAGGNQAHDIWLNVVHNQPQCTSREYFKGILHGQGRALFDGTIVVQPGAQQTDARLGNDNLLLSRTAEIETRPRLEIYADDVQCSHGTTVGQIDPEMLFYLRSRGIPQKQAVNMICSGFADEVIAACGWTALEVQAREIVSRQLSQAAAHME